MTLGQARGNCSPGPEGSGKISAIDGGNVLRIEGMQIARVIPIEEMAAK